MASGPVLVLIKSTQCGACRSLSNVWPNIVSRLKTDHSQLRFVTFELDNMQGRFDETKMPASLSKFMSWFPMILLVPGSLWDAAQAALPAGKNNNVDLTKGTQILNGVRVGDRLQMSQPMRYNPSDPEQMSAWVQEILVQPEFKEAPRNNFLVPAPNHAQNFNQNGTLPPRPVQAQAAQAPDVCSLRLISRPAK